ncbi:MFS transport protein AraJ [compost metagenome]
MIQAATGSEMIASAALQASFNIGNALGAFLGGIPLVMGYDFTSPNFVGLLMALVGALITSLLILKFRNQNAELSSQRIRKS